MVWNSGRNSCWKSSWLCLKIENKKYFIYRRWNHNQLSWRRYVHERYGNTGCGVFNGGMDTQLERFLAPNQLQSNEIIEFWELEYILARCQKLGIILEKGFKNWCYQKMSITTNVSLTWYSSMKKKSERFRWFLT